MHSVFPLFASLAEVDRPPFLRGEQTVGAECDLQRSSSGTGHRGPHSHTGEGSVQADSTAAEKPLQYSAAVHHPYWRHVTFGAAVIEKIQEKKTLEAY